MLVDVPANLVTAYYYLSNKYGLEKVKILKTRNEIQDYREKFKKNNLILLIPSCFYDEIRNYDLNLISNFGSFSEMGYKTIEYYKNNNFRFYEVGQTYYYDKDFKSFTEKHKRIGLTKLQFGSDFYPIFYFKYNFKNDSIFNKNHKFIVENDF